MTDQQPIHHSSSSQGPIPEELLDSGTGDDNIPTVLKKLQKWGDYDNFGTPVHPTRFIPMKTPISKELVITWGKGHSPQHMHTVQTMVEEQRIQGREIGLILDLSNHDCLYTEDLSLEPQVQYEHIHLVAKEIPSRECVNRVIQAANAFWRLHPEKHIAIHCTYGFNRTGFVVASYLIQHLGVSVEEGLAAFKEARPPGVKHEIFKEELRNRYDGSNEGEAPRPRTAPDAAEKPSGRPDSDRGEVEVKVRVTTGPACSAAHHPTRQARMSADLPRLPPPVIEEEGEVAEGLLSVSPSRQARLTDSGLDYAPSSSSLAQELSQPFSPTGGMAGASPFRKLLPGALQRRLRNGSASQESFGEFSEEDYAHFNEYCAKQTPGDASPPSAFALEAAAQAPRPPPHPPLPPAHALGPHRPGPSSSNNASGAVRIKSPLALAPAHPPPPPPCSNGTSASAQTHVSNDTARQIQDPFPPARAGPPLLPPATSEPSTNPAGPWDDGRTAEDLEHESFGQVTGQLLLSALKIERQKSENAGTQDGVGGGG